MKEKSIEILKGIAIIAGYQILPAFMMIPFSIYIKNQTIRYITLYLTILIGLLYIYRKDILKEIKKFKFNYLINTTVYWLIGLTIMITSSTILHNLGIDIATNQQNNINLLKEMPIAETIIAVFIGPIIEEIVFRRSLYNAIENKHAFAIITGLIFGSTHVLFKLHNPLELLYIINYSSCGIAFGYAYKENDNIIPTILIHSLHNAITLLLLII